jgi:glycosyltransferase involved in cell wall biosynthesis
MRGLNESQIHKLIQTKLNRFQIARLETVVQVFLNEALISKVSTKKDLEFLVKHPKLSSIQIAALLLLTLRGRYPTPDEMHPVQSCIKRGDWQKAIVIADSNYEAGVTLAFSDNVILDVTRFSDQRQISGIPRIVNELVKSKPFNHAVLGVWESGVLGIAVKDEKNFIKFARSHWQNPRRKSNLVVKWYMTFANIAIKNPSITFLFIQSLKPIRPFARKLVVKLKNPKVGILLHRTNYYLPEVPNEDVSLRLGVWKEAFPEVKISVILHDLLPITNPELFRADSNRQHLFFVRLLSCVDRIIVATKVLQSQLIPAMKLFETSETKISVIPLPASLRVSDRDDFEKHRQYSYFLFIGGYEKRKGLRKLVEYLESRPLSGINFKVLVPGLPWPQQGSDVWDTGSKLHYYPEIFKPLGLVDDHLLSELYRDCVAVLYLSEAEGYGLPVIEALLSGKPVLTLDTPTNRELATSHKGVWAQFDFADNTGFALLQDMASSGTNKSPMFEVLFNYDVVSTPEEWAVKVFDSLEDLS